MSDSEDDSSTEPCSCYECMQFGRGLYAEAVDGSSDADSLMTGDYLPNPDYSTMSLIALAGRRFRRPAILDAELMVPDGPAPDSFMYQLMKKLSLEMISEVFSWLHPIDLIYLSYTTKELRDFLVQNKSIWKIARDRLPVSLPDCPPRTTEEQWALLLFTNECIFCSEETTVTKWGLRIRVCDNCLPNAYCRLDSRSMNKLLDGCDGDLVRSLMLPYNKRYWLKCDIVEIVSAIKEHSGSSAEASEESKEALRQCCEEKKAEVEALKTFHDVCKQHYPSLDDLKQLMKHSYISYASQELSLEGYAAIDITATFLSSNLSRGVIWTVPAFRELDNCGWKEIKLELVKLIDVNHRLRLEKGRKSDIANFINMFCREWTRDEPGLVPPWLDVMHWPLISTIVATDVFTWEKAVVLEALKAPLIDALRKWRSQQVDLFLRLVPETGEENNDTALQHATVPKDRLTLATTLFKCHGGTNAGSFLYDEVAGGKHLPCFPDSPRDRRVTSSSSNWCCLRFDTVGSKRIAALLEKVGLDPKTTTIQDMDTQCGSLRFLCVGCWKDKGMVRPWRECVRHLVIHSDRPFFDWRCLDSVEVEDAYKLEEAFLKKTEKATFICKQCLSPTLLSWTALLDHQLHVHQISTGLTGGVHYGVDRSAPGTPCVMVPSLIPRGVEEKSKKNKKNKKNGEFQYQCALCSSSSGRNGSARMFNLGGVQDHLAAKHGISRNSATIESYIKVGA